MPSTFINRADEVLPGLWIGDASSCAAAHELGFNLLFIDRRWANLNPPLPVTEAPVRGEFP